jgi:ParB-like chromosome segregation protein Spo0J
VLAAKHLGWETIPVHVIDIEKIAQGEHDENFFRKNFTPTELVAIKRTLDPDEKVAAKERQREGGRSKGKASRKFREAKGRAIDKVAKATGVSSRTIEKAETVVKAAEAAPEKYASVAAKMDRTGKVDPAFRAVTGKADSAEASAERRKRGAADSETQVPPTPTPETSAELIRLWRKATDAERLAFVRTVGLIKAIGLDDLVKLIPESWLPAIVEHYGQKTGGRA